MDIIVISILLAFSGGVLFLHYLPTYLRKIESSRFVYQLQEADWFQKPVYAGLFIFGVNAFLFSLVWLLVLMPLFQQVWSVLLLLSTTTLCSVWFWMVSSRAYRQPSGRWIFSVIGSSFYLFCFLLLLYIHTTVAPVDLYLEVSFFYLIGAFIALAASIIQFFVTSIEPRQLEKEQT
ncbi:hypothetical protein JCM19046_109 [Bacillus sp. JCM 19046]|nr:hypothetical protein JCM19045_2278 [Bacillus sp. JCM 19045]GAF15713.1 hypothetical protein JCM19046_109 [Bacillus sp. JCM 19046]